MTRVLRLAIILWALAWALLILAAVHYADTARAQQVPGTWTANNPYLNAMNGEARYHWNLRGVNSPPINIMFIHSADCGGCWGYTPPGPYMYIQYENFAGIQAHPADQGTNSDVCAVMFHESGHAAGLGHWTTGWMSMWGPGYMPARCYQIADARARGRYP